MAAPPDAFTAHDDHLAHACRGEPLVQRGDELGGPRMGGVGAERGHRPPRVLRAVVLGQRPPTAEAFLPAVGDAQLGKLVGQQIPAHVGTVATAGEAPNVHHLLYARGAQ